MNVCDLAISLEAMDPYFLYLLSLGALMGSAGAFFVWRERRQAAAVRRR